MYMYVRGGERADQLNICNTRGEAYDISLSSPLAQMDYNYGEKYIFRISCNVNRLFSCKF